MKALNLIIRFIIGYVAMTVLINTVGVSLALPIFFTGLLIHLLFLLLDKKEEDRVWKEYRDQLED